jgi:hypothetical protein
MINSKIFYPYFFPGAREDGEEELRVANLYAERFFIGSDND